MPPLTPVVQALLLLNVGAFCLAQLLPWLSPLLALFPVGFGFWPWQLITYSFLHGDLNHLFFNMLGLWMFGSELERVWGPKRFIQFYLASVLVAALTQLLLAVILSHHQPTVGASGGLFGLLMAYGMLFPNRIIMPLIPPIPMKARTFVMVYGAIELLLGVFYSNNSQVAHFAHLGGMLGGWLVLRYWRGRLPFQR